MSKALGLPTEDFQNFTLSQSGDVIVQSPFLSNKQLFRAAKPVFKSVISPIRGFLMMEAKGKTQTINESIEMVKVLNMHYNKRLPKL